MNGRVLVVDDEQSMCELLEADLRLRDFNVSWTTSAEKAYGELGRSEFDVVLTDLHMPEVTGLELCQRIAANRPDIPVVVMTAFGSMDAAVASIRNGAYDFVTKPVELDVLDLVLQRAVRHRQLNEKIQLLSRAIEKSQQFGELLGTSAVMQKLYDLVSRLVESEATILITGESGTGKELVARSIHSKSRRAQGPFVAVNCAALPDTLLESELFGHEKGAFTDARGSRKGLFAQADGGTLLLDEIGELPLAMQPKLLRVLEEGKVRPVGGEREVPIDVRLLAATNRDLESAVEQGRFREDLYFRINVIQVETPPLRARGTDTLLLAQHFVDIFAARSATRVVGISKPVAERLLNYSWPGNVRELRNVIERAVTLTRHDRVTIEDLPDRIRNYQSSQVVLGGEDPSELVTLDEMERRYILHVVSCTGDNKAMAARLLGMDRTTLYRRLRDYGLSAPGTPE